MVIPTGVRVSPVLLDDAASTFDHFTRLSFTGGITSQHYPELEYTIAKYERTLHRLHSLPFRCLRANPALSLIVLLLAKWRQVFINKKGGLSREMVGLGSTAEYW